MTLKSPSGWDLVHAAGFRVWGAARHERLHPLVRGAWTRIARLKTDQTFPASLPVQFSFPPGTNPARFGRQSHEGLASVPALGEVLVPRMLLRIPLVLRRTQKLEVVFKDDLIVSGVHDRERGLVL